LPLLHRLLEHKPKMRMFYGNGLSTSPKEIIHHGATYTRKHKDPGTTVPYHRFDAGQFHGFAGSLGPSQSKGPITFRPSSCREEGSESLCSESDFIECVSTVLPESTFAIFHSKFLGTPRSRCGHSGYGGRGRSCKVTWKQQTQRTGTA